MKPVKIEDHEKGLLSEAVIITQKILRRLLEENGSDASAGPRNGPAIMLRVLSGGCVFWDVVMPGIGRVADKTLDGAMRRLVDYPKVDDCWRELVASQQTMINQLTAELEYLTRGETRMSSKESWRKRHDQR